MNWPKLQWCVRIPRRRVNTFDTSEVPFTFRAAVMEAPPSVLLATHWYVPLSFFSAPATSKEPSPRVKKRTASTASEVPLLTLQEKHFTACHAAAGALVNVPPRPSLLQCCHSHLFLAFRANSVLRNLQTTPRVLLKQ